MQKVVIVCDGLFGLEICSIIEEINKYWGNKYNEEKYKLVGIVGIHSRPFSEQNCPIRFLGTIEKWSPADDIKVVMGVQMPDIKKEVVQFLCDKNVEFETIVAPWMLSFPEWLTIGKGCIVAPYSAKPGMVIGDFVSIVSAMLSGHSIGDYSTVMRFANIAGDSIGMSSFIGDHVFLAVGKNIGDNCYVAPGSIVVNNVKHGTSVFGVPAKKNKMDAK